MEHENWHVLSWPNDERLRYNVHITAALQSQFAYLFAYKQYTHFDYARTVFAYINIDYLIHT